MGGGTREKVKNGTSRSTRKSAQFQQIVSLSESLSSESENVAPSTLSEVHEKVELTKNNSRKKRGGKSEGKREESIEDQTESSSSSEQVHFKKITSRSNIFGRGMHE